MKIKEIEKKITTFYLNDADIILLILNKKGNIEVINKKGSELLGYKQKELIGKNWFKKCIPKENRKEIQKLFNKAIKSKIKKISKEYQNPIITKNNKIKIIRWTNQLILNEKGKTEYTISSGIDITETEETKKELKKIIEEWKKTFDSIPEPISIHDRNFKITKINKAFENTFKLEQKEIINKRCYKIVHKTKEPIKECPYLQTIKTKTSTTREIYDKNLKKYLEVSVSPILNENKELEGVIHIIRDITERKEQEEKIKETLTELNKFNKFVVGRELRMIELKKEINELLKKQGKKPKYKIK